MTAHKPWFGKNEARPQKGNVLVLHYHHDGESHWCSPEQVIARIEHILGGGKPEEERGPRMEAMQIIPFGTWWDAKALSEADAVRAKAYSEADAVRAKARREADAIWDEAFSEANGICAKARREADAIWDKACKKAYAIWAKARREADAIWDKACAAILAKAPEKYPAEAWAAKWMEAHP